MLFGPQTKITGQPSSSTKKASKEPFEMRFWGEDSRIQHGEGIRSTGGPRLMTTIRECTNQSWKSTFSLPFLCAFFLFSFFVPVFPLFSLRFYVLYFDQLIENVRGEGPSRRDISKDKTATTTNPQPLFLSYSPWQAWISSPMAECMLWDTSRPLPGSSCPRPTEATTGSSGMTGRASCF